MAETTERLASSSRTGSGWNIAAGVWLILAPFILGYGGVIQASRNDIIAGAIVLVLALVGTYLPKITWSRWLNIVVGAWLLIAPFMLGYSGLMAAAWNDIVLGILVIAFAGWSANFAHKLHHQSVGGSR